MAVQFLIPLAVGALVLAGCTKAVTEVRKSRPLATLEGSEWSPLTPGATEQFVAFKAGGDIAGNGGCNNFFGQYTQDGPKLTIGALASTKKMCATGMEDEAAFMKNLQDTRRAEATHKSLTLYGAEDNILMELKRRDWD
ncbi:META domain-containing protein [Litorimonas sp. WD9-15]|uniref:META domain-containing protein n=1 Tax=Litorimonas sp. WD9-15 TaxID=3418716 RepID=UPI003CFC2B36